jgi:YVTN family beta-propeller protein
MRHRNLRSSAALGLALAATLAAAPATADVIIPEGSTGTALRLDGNFQPIGRIQGLGNVHGMDTALSRGLLVSASLDEQPRSEIAKPASMSEGEHAKHHAKSGNKKMAEGDISLVRLVSIETGEIVRQIEVPGMVHHVTVGANDRYAVLTHPSLDAVSVIDLETNEVTATIATGPNPNYAVYDPETATFFVSNAGNATISQVDPAQGYVLRNIRTPGGVEHMAIDPQGRRLFAAEAETGLVSAVNLDSGAIEQSWNVGGQLHGIAYDAARDAVYVSAREKGAIGWIDLATGQLSVEPVGPEPYHMALAGNRLVISSAEEDVAWTVDVTSRKLISTVPTSERGHQMAVLPES